MNGEEFLEMIENWAGGTLVEYGPDDYLLIDEVFQPHWMWVWKVRRGRRVRRCVRGGFRR